MPILRGARFTVEDPGSDVKEWRAVSGAIQELCGALDSMDGDGSGWVAPGHTASEAEGTVDNRNRLVSRKNTTNYDTVACRCSVNATFLFHNSPTNKKPLQACFD